MNLNIEENMQNIFANLSIENMTKESLRLVKIKMKQLENQVKQEKAIAAAAVRENKRYKESAKIRKEQSKKG